MYLSGIEPHADDAVLTDVRARLASAPELAGCAIEASCTNGVVTLRGAVPTSEIRDSAEQIAFDVRGVFDVLNRLRVTAGAAATPSPEPPREETSVAPLDAAPSDSEVADEEPASDPAPDTLDRDDEPPNLQ